MIVDADIFYFINGFAGKWQWLDWLGIFFAQYLGYILLFSLLVFLLIYPIKLSRKAGQRFALQIVFDRAGFKKYWRMVAEGVVAALFVRFVLVEIFYWLRFRMRPFVDGNNNLLISYDISKTAFPSGHASFYFALSTIIYGYHKKAGILFFIASFLISIGRVFVGVHWPSDILAGALLGIIMGLVLNKLFKKISIKKSQ
ncbi:MAG: hypothetical protein A3A98_03920 [Candidatus Staskawiczbacteria bacterium RIFCSPLOWO2_01_FULL_40_39]|uniref:Phosphatidic acid phosphatase type 2/haloperoxidase domain-containing protein n=1 Tax=Candidatus Staskawiczbacteria bacterium RIFCSPHIGHO2_01_FULL_39_25 TaxID=1802202 RepID=A0A1G2HNJ5_9BACT|nr:MAG: hypothetical protein A2730_03135 [Candidatus Staskawiczbacteria bacterium RIFCSPHIGHO2_01_FULL_39_25]OGZ73918.1 MAG: hypothetical protein A3A98_03920 [Candidatus Staskawiczbacteria bacterium RIFCSPLOWO2_01_FULL_40_39]OGZ76546.1 MAG: hypothetical protein A3I87_00335 [Candidatus Staskawiczbacteria bacterium RIFCSPLOWO2_02_FULL_39_8]